MTSSLGTMGKTKTSLLGVKNYRIELKICTLVEDRKLYNIYSGFLKILKILDFMIIFLKKNDFLKFLGSKYQNLKNPRWPFCRPCFSMYYLFFVCIWLKISIFGEFSNIYLLSAQNRVKWRHKIRPIAKNFRPILIFFARDDAKLMPGEVC